MKRIYDFFIEFIETLLVTFFYTILTFFPVYFFLFFLLFLLSLIGLDFNFFGTTIFPTLFILPVFFYAVPYVLITSLFLCWVQTKKWDAVEDRIKVFIYFLFVPFYIVLMGHYCNSPGNLCYI